MDLSAKTSVQAVLPSSAWAILKKMKKALKVANNDTSDIFDLDELDARLTAFDFDDEDKDSGENYSEDKETLEAEVDASNSIGKALLLVKQVSLSCYYNPHQHHDSHNASDLCFS